VPNLSKDTIVLFKSEPNMGQLATMADTALAVTLENYRGKAVGIVKLDLFSPKKIGSTHLDIFIFVLINFCTTTPLATPLYP